MRKQSLLDSDQAFFNELNVMILSFKRSLNTISSNYFTLIFIKRNNLYIQHSKETLQKSIESITLNFDQNKPIDLSKLKGRLEFFNYLLTSYYIKDVKFKSLASYSFTISNLIDYIDGAISKQELEQNKRLELQFNAIMQLQQTAQNASNRVEELDSEKSVLQKKNNELIKLNDNPKYIKEILENQQAIEQQLKESRKNSIELKKQCNSIRQSFESTQKLLVGMKEERDTAKTKVKELFTQNQEEQDKSAQLGQHLDKARSSKKELSIQNANLSHEKYEIIKEKQLLIEDKNTLLANIDALMLNNEVYKTKLKAVEKNYSILEKNYTSLEKNLSWAITQSTYVLENNESSSRDQFKEIIKLRKKLYTTEVQLKDVEFKLNNIDSQEKKHTGNLFFNR